MQMQLKSLASLWTKFSLHHKTVDNVSYIDSYKTFCEWTIVANKNANVRVT